MKKLFTLFTISLLFSIQSDAQLVYKDVASIFFNRCTPCHHTGGGAPFSMMSYSQTAPWASLIDADLQSGKMPPWQPDTNYTRFLHERIVTSSEKAAIQSWIASGALKGDTTLAPPAPVYSKHKLKGTPDLILQIPTFSSNAGSADAYNCFSLPTGLAQDRMIRAFEVVPGNSDIVHHVVVKVDTTGTVQNNLNGNCFTEPGDFVLDVYAPGGAPTVYPGKAPLKMGVKLKAGSNIIFQIHYPPGTAGQLDSTQIRLYFYPQGTTGIRPVVTSTPLQNWFMNIQANKVDSFTARYPSVGGLPLAVSVFAAFPHSHLLCTTMRNWADNASSTIPLIKINKWDFEWQGFYFYRNLVKVPAGYVIRSSHTFDNTTNNPNNPFNPPQNVGAGTGTNDEMLFDSFQYLAYLPGDETIDIGNLLSNDTLLVSSVPGNYQGVIINGASAAPNPFSDFVTISYNTVIPAQTSVSVFDLYGNKVRDLSFRLDASGEQSVIWDGRNNNGFVAAPGIYFYTIDSGHQSVSGKLVWMPR